MALSPTSSHSGGTTLGNVTTVTGTPAVGESVVATSATAAAWATATPSAGGKGDNAGNKTTTSGSFVDAGITATVAAATGDKLLVLLTGAYQISVAAAGRNCYFQVITTTGSNVMGAGVYVPPSSTSPGAVSICGVYTVVSGDVSGGNVACKVQFAVDAGFTLTLFNAGGNDFSFSVVNLSH